VQLIDEAVACVRRGWWVFPCQPGSKQPMTEHGLNDASNDEPAILAWWREHPQANIGVSCGPSGLLVIDVDHPAGAESWHRLCAEDGIAVRTVVSLTPAGGHHEYFAAPQGLAAKNSAGRLAPNLDVRTAGGYVIAPPSRHPNGGIYRWAPGQGPGEVPLAPLPEPLVRRLAALAGAGEGNTIASRRRGQVRDIRRYGQAALQREAQMVRQAPEGTRNDRLNRAAFCLGRLVAQGALAPAEVEEELAYAAIRAGLPPGDVARTIRSGLEAGIAIGRHMRPCPEIAGNARRGAARHAALWMNPPGHTAEGPSCEPGVAAGDGPEPQNFHLTDAGNGELIAALYAERLRYDHDRGAWLLWDGTRWRPDKKGEVRSLAVEAARRRGETALEILDLDLAKRTERWALGSESGARLREALNHARNLRPIGIEHAELDADPWVLGCPNGVLDLRTGTLRSAAPDDLITCATGVPFDPQAPAPRWERFLQEICVGDAELVEALARAAGYSLTGITREQVIFMCLGDGANGKSTFLNALGAVLGDYAGHATSGCFEQPHHGETLSNDVAMLAGKRLVTVEETGENRCLYEQRVKQMTGGDPITARFLYREHFTFFATFKLWMATNYRPRIAGTDNGIWRRVREIPFRATFQGREDLDLASTLAAELPGILAWAVRGCLAWQREGLGLPSAVSQATEDYRVESDPVRRFLAECVDKTPGARLSATAFYKAYATWCHREDGVLITQTRFGRRLDQLGYPKSHTEHGTVYEGVVLTVYEN